MVRQRGGRRQRPERTREHYIEALSRNYVERFILLRGHTVNEPRPDYGYDIVITTYDFEGDPEFKSGTSENGLIYIQLKATDHLNVLADGETISFQIKRRHAVHWEAEPMPIYLVVYSVKDNQAYWLHMQPYLKSSGFTMPPEEQVDGTVHLSRHSLLDENAIDTFRQNKQEVLKRVGRLKLYE